MPLRSGRPYLRWDPTLWICHKSNYMRHLATIAIDKAVVMNNSDQVDDCSEKSPSIEHAWKYVPEYICANLWPHPKCSVCQFEEVVNQTFIRE